MLGWRGSPARSLIAMCLIHALAGCANRGEPSPSISLDQQFRVVLPDAYPIAGAAISPSQDVIVWSRKDPLLYMIGRSHTAMKIAIGRFRRPVAAAFVSGDTLLEVVDAMENEIIRVSSLGELRGTTILPRDWRLMSAHHLVDRWIFALRDSAVGTIITGSPTAAAIMGAQPLDVQMPRLGHRELALSGTGTRPLAAFINPPFDGASVSRSGALEPFPKLTLPAGFTLRDTTVKNRDWWVALPILALDRGTLQVLADLRSDARVLVLRDSLGVVTRWRSLDAPIGFIASDVGARALVASIGASRNEIAVYRWRWTDDN
jgi:hypothetical protein